jgi:hypothetical protein
LLCEGTRAIHNKQLGFSSILSSANSKRRHHRIGDEHLTKTSMAFFFLCCGRFRSEARSAGKQIANIMKHLGSTISRQIKNQTKTRQNSDDTQIFRPDLRFASRKNSKTTQKKGPNPQPKTPKKPQNFPWTRRKNPTCHEKCTKKQISKSTAQKTV